MSMKIGIQWKMEAHTPFCIVLIRSTKRCLVAIVNHLPKRSSVHGTGILTYIKCEKKTWIGYIYYHFVCTVSVLNGKQISQSEYESVSCCGTKNLAETYCRV